MGWEGRVALLGDAGYGATMGGMGAGVAIVGAYVLAGELALAGGDHRTAFAAYEIPDPGLRQGLPWMYRLLASRPLAAFFKRLTEQSATDIKLPEYPAG
ncbi:hypothetical protein ADL12_33460 [Streptomyces regalis]|uniref:FAD-binding domain-containing protein n=1 Tax=Streptomyces regalis TaxID=68262 RepID=A0A117MMW2_9ACTN|nr:hypothetical protein ADL12_33460 [Streptomyces regalis]